METNVELKPNQFYLEEPYPKNKLRNFLFINDVVLLALLGPVSIYYFMHLLILLYLIAWTSFMFPLIVIHMVLLKTIKYKSRIKSLIVTSILLSIGLVAILVSLFLIT
jgi:hypothetical protein